MGRGEKRGLIVGRLKETIAAAADGEAPGSVQRAAFKPEEGHDADRADGHAQKSHESRTHALRESSRDEGGDNMTEGPGREQEPCGDHGEAKPFLKEKRVGCDHG